MTGEPDGPGVGVIVDRVLRDESGQVVIRRTVLCETAYGEPLGVVVEDLPPPPWTGRPSRDW